MKQRQRRDTQNQAKRHTNTRERCENRQRHEDGEIERERETNSSSEGVLCKSVNTLTTAECCSSVRRDNQGLEKRASSERREGKEGREVK
jgi:hypothetical protein